MTSLKSQMLEDIAGFTHDPLSFVKYAYPWGEGELSGIGSDGPRTWQKDILSTIGNHLKNKETRFTPLLISVSSGHGIGKSALVAQVIDWGMSTCEDCKIVVTANTEPQLRTKTWPEVSKWFRSSINADWFKTTATAVVSADRSRDRTWRADAIAWSENNTEAFAGLHNKGKRVILIFDEASGIAPKVWEVAKGALTDENTEIIWLAFGNPTRNDGDFHDCFGSQKHRWITRQIDSRTVEGVNKAQLQQWVDDYGEDSDFVRVRVRGVFPRAGTFQFIDSESVNKCLFYGAEGFESMAKVIGLDVARFGDDQNVAASRQGRKVSPLMKWRGVDTMQTASRAARIYEEEKPDMMFVDGGGMGAGVVDRLRELIPPNKVMEVNFGSKPHDKKKYYNKRAEMWGLMRDAIKAGLDFPDDLELTTDLTGVQYGFSAQQQIQLEKKDDMKHRGLSSPDCGDALALTFAEIVIKEKPVRREKVQTATDQLKPKMLSLAECY